MEDIMVLCKKCGNRVPASLLKLDLDEKKMICPECVKNKNIHKEIEEEVFHKIDNAKVQPKTAFPQGNQEEKSMKVKHKCTSCGFKLKIDPETKTPKNCPYCNARILSY